MMFRSSFSSYDAVLSEAACTPACWLSQAAATALIFVPLLLL